MTTMTKTVIKFILHILCVPLFFVTIPLVFLQIIWYVIAFCFGYDDIPDPVPFMIVDKVNEWIDKI
jgi:hypothetical protein